MSLMTLEGGKYCSETKISLYSDNIYASEASNPGLSPEVAPCPPFIFQASHLTATTTSTQRGVAKQFAKAKAGIIMIDFKESTADCKFAAGIMIPVIDPLRCEAAGPCVPICPYNVLAIREVPAAEKAQLPLIGRFKLFVHGGKQAFALDPDSCHGCGLCVQACPEKAIKLQKRQKV